MSVTYAYEIDLEEGVPTDISEYVKECNIERGRDTQLDQFIAGRCYLRLNNADNRFSPWLSTSDYYPDLTYGKRGRVKVTKDASTYYLFDGYITNIEPTPQKESQECTIELLDPLNRITNIESNVPLQESRTSGQLIDAILDSIGWSALRRNIDTGQDTIAYSSISGRMALEAIQEIVNSERGNFYAKGNGNVAFEDRHHRMKSPHDEPLFTIDNTMRDLKPSQPIDLLFNEIKITAHPLQVLASGELWYLRETINIAAGQSAEVWADYTDPDTKAEVICADDVITPVATDDYLANSQPDGLGTDLTATLGNTVIDSYSETNQNDNALIDSYSESNYSGGSYLSGYTDDYQKISQSITGKSSKLSSHKWYLKKLGSPTGNAVAVLYAHTGTYGTSSKPTGAALATSDNFDVSTLTTSYQLITFTFTGAQQYPLVNGTYYCMTIEYSGGDHTNCVIVGLDGISPTHSGNSAGYYNSAWTIYSARDEIFYVYGDVSRLDDVKTHIGHSFTAAAGDITKNEFYLKKVGTPTGNATAILYAHSGTFGVSSIPTGAALATSDNFDVSTLTTSYALKNFTFTGAQQYTMTSGTKYVIAIKYTGGDASNYVSVGIDSTAPTHNGNFCYYDGSWGYNANCDICFYVYVGTPVALYKYDKRAKIVITNNLSITAYITFLRIRGKPVVSYDASPIISQDITSQTNYGKRTLQLDLVWQQDLGTAQDFAQFLLAQHKDPLTLIENTMQAQKSDAIETQILTREISDRIAVKETTTGIDDEFFIEFISHHIEPQYHECIWKLMPTDRYGNYWVLGVSQLDTEARLAY